MGCRGIKVDERLSRYGLNELPTYPPPSVWVVARGPLPPHAKAGTSTP